ncbi:thiol-disulfide isomerase/thioredoxin [Saonia flava]|uniref:Thiol-disulfide isomerase/thioredoxin n=1 Tax=Saonia flava TaxID=523696 RepID=A0A846QX15_9FLAO|nr:TlpA disulfide reductase family protein [Saonia flava]NJB71767.1 thiol-disulfide isomerase/thioredoxin [Saonia flava]
MHKIKEIISILVVLFSFGLQAQHSIYGTFSPAKDYKWVIAYELKPGDHRFVANTKLQNGNFALNIPKDAPTGTYRMVYGVPQEELYFDIIYSGKEDVQLNFDSKQGVTFLSSKENIPFRDYFTEIAATQQEIINCYQEGITDESVFLQLGEKLKSVQQAYEKKTEGLIAQKFIKANSPYISPKYEPIQEYIQHTKKNYFNSLDLTDPILQSSSFLTDKISNYVFTSLPMGTINTEEKEHAMIENVKRVNTEMVGVSAVYKLHVFHSLWRQAAGDKLNNVSDFIFNELIKKLANETNRPKVIDDIEFYNSLRIGATASEITWKDGNTNKSLSTLKGASTYILVFWSSTCSHCLKELPALHKELKKYPKVKVVAVGLEDNETTWKPEAAKLSDFEHAIALGRWNSDYAKQYGIQRTPTYFILDKDKHIVAKPQTDKEVITFLRNK